MKLSIKRIVDTSFWEDSKVIDKYSVEDKYFLLYLITNPHTTQVGIYKLPKRIISFETGYTVETVNVILERFQNKYFNIIYDNATQEIAVLNSLKYSIVKGGKPVSDLIEKELSTPESDRLIQAVYDKLEPFWIRSIRPFDSSIKKLFEKELKKRDSLININDNDNDNDNDNEESYHESYNESYHESSKEKSAPKKSKPKPTRHKYGNYENVLLTDEQLNTLKNEFPRDWQARIDRLDEYIASTGKSYKNHLATIRMWAKRDNKPNKQVVVKEKVPDWVDNPIKEPKINHEMQKEYMAKLQEMRAKDDG